jgi:predicted nucleic acid-binding protein
MLGKNRVCWDSCAFISLLTGENRTPEEMKKLYEIENMVNQGRCVVFTSTVAIVEVLDCHLTPEQAVKFKGLIGNPDTPFLSVDTRVAQLAHDIRSFYAGKISTPDSIFLATAIHYEAAAFHTYDGSSKRRREGDLLRLPQPIAGKYKMPITLPEVPVEPPPELLRAAFETEAIEEPEPLLLGIDAPQEQGAQSEPEPPVDSPAPETKAQHIQETIAKVIPEVTMPDKTGITPPKIEKG